MKKKNRMMSFNPCFRGCRSGTDAVTPPVPVELVSILVFVDVALEQKKQFPIGVGSRMFQSLFSWMSLWNRHPPDFSTLVKVSILVFVDVALELEILFAARFTGEFQSLFSWMSLWERY